MNVDLGSKRPDCQGCGSKETATMFVYGMMLCGDCIMKIDAKNKEVEADKVSKMKAFLKGDS